VKSLSVSPLNTYDVSPSFGPKSWSSQIARCVVAVSSGLQRLELALAAIAVRDRLRIEEIGLLQVEIVAEPQHTSGFAVGDCVKDSEAAAVVLARVRRILVGEKEARADRDRKVERVLRLQPIGLRPNDPFADDRRPAVTRYAAERPGLSPESRATTTWSFASVAVRSIAAHSLAVDAPAHAHRACAIVGSTRSRW
jgi:hypothetical protein